MKNDLFALFPSREDADGAVADLEQAGIPRDRISTIERQGDAEATLTADRPATVGREAGIGAEAGAAGGATAGVIGGLILGAAGPLGFLPGLLAAVATGVGGSILGGATGGLVGALVGSGFPEGVARSYEKGIREGQILVGTATEGFPEENIRNIYKLHNGTEIQSVMVDDRT